MMPTLRRKRRSEKTGGQFRPPVEYASGAYRLWVAESGRVAVRESVGLPIDGLRKAYRVLQAKATPTGSCWSIVSRHKRRGAAFRAAARLDRRLGKAR